MAWYHIAFGMSFQLMYSFITSCAGYAPFILMTLIERYFEERKWKKLKAQQQKLAEEEAIYKEDDEEEEEGGAAGMEDEGEEGGMEDEYQYAYG